MSRLTPLQERKESKSSIISVLAILVAAMSITSCIGFSTLVQPFQGIFKQLGAEIPFPTGLILLSYPWLWLGAVFSGATWWFHRQRRLSKSWAVGILSSIAISTVTYLVVGTYLLYLTMFNIFDSVK
jgi:hypothetical protein